MKNLIFAVAFALAAAAVIVAAAVYRSWNETHMTIVTVAGSLTCLAVPISAGVATYLAVQSKQERRAEAEREKRILAMLEEQKRLSVVTLAEQRQQTEGLRQERMSRMLATLQASQPMLGGPPANNPWATEDWGEDDDLAPVSL